MTLSRKGRHNEKVFYLFNISYRFNSNVPSCITLEGLRIRRFFRVESYYWVAKQVFWCDRDELPGCCGLPGGSEQG